MNDAEKLFTNDESLNYFTENNETFLETTSIIKSVKQNDQFFRPYFMSNAYYDIKYGGVNAFTPLRYDLNYRNYYVVTKGNIELILIPPKYTKYLHVSHNYEILENKSPINPWNVQKQYKNIFKKIKMLKYTITTNDCIFIPAYWWYSIKFTENSSVCTMQYRTYMNTLAISPYLAMYYLQINNTRLLDIKPTEKYNLSEQIDNKNIVNAENSIIEDIENK